MSATIMFCDRVYAVVRRPIRLKVNGEAGRQCASVPRGPVYLVAIQSDSAGLIALVSREKLPRKADKREQVFCRINIQHLVGLEPEDIEDLSQIAAALQAVSTPRPIHPPRKRQPTNQVVVVGSRPRPSA